MVSKGGTGVWSGAEAVVCMALQEVESGVRAVRSCSSSRGEIEREECFLNLFFSFTQENSRGVFSQHKI